MKIQLIWFKDKSGFYPRDEIWPSIERLNSPEECQEKFKVLARPEEHGYVNLLTGLLADDGGLSSGYLSYLDLMQKMLDELDLVENGEKEHCGYCAESWGAQAFKDRTDIYFAYDVDYFETLPTPMFKKILTEWVKFIQEPPDLNKKVVIELDDVQ